LANFQPEEYFETEKIFLKNKKNRIKKNQIHKLNCDKESLESKKIEMFKKLKNKKLTEKLKNVQDLNDISRALTNQKDLIVMNFFIFI